jgi:hypothetical protein
MMTIGLFATVVMALTIWMTWRILEKMGFPGWLSIAHLLSLTGVGLLATIVMFWLMAFIRWPRDEQALAPAGMPGASPPPASPIPGALPSPPSALPPPVMATPTTRWALDGTLGDGRPGRLLLDDSRTSYLVSRAAESGDLVVPDPSIGTPHARLLTAAGRLGLEDLGSEGGTWIDGVRLLPAHGARDITGSSRIRFGVVELVLSRA